MASAVANGEPMLGAGVSHRAGIGSADVRRPTGGCGAARVVRRCEGASEVLGGHDVAGRRMAAGGANSHAAPPRDAPRADQRHGIRGAVRASRQACPVCGRDRVARHPQGAEPKRMARDLPREDPRGVRTRGWALAHCSSRSALHASVVGRERAACTLRGGRWPCSRAARPSFARDRSGVPARPALRCTG
jgi:hypothetical protein